MNTHKMYGDNGELVWECSTGCEGCTTPEAPVEVDEPKGE